MSKPTAQQLARQRLAAIDLEMFAPPPKGKTFRNAADEQLIRQRSLAGMFPTSYLPGTHINRVAHNRTLGTRWRGEAARSISIFRLPPTPLGGIKIAG